MKHLTKTILLFAFILTSLELNAVPAYPYPVKVLQPDGTEITIILRGDEHFHFRTTQDGYPILKSANGFYNYAKVDNSGNMTDSKVKVSNMAQRNVAEIDFLKKLPQNFVKKSNTLLMSKVKGAAKATSSASKFPTKGAMKSIVILVNFSDLSFVTPTPKSAYTDLLNKEGYSTNGGTGSARDYFVDNSMGVFQPDFDVYGPYTLPNPYVYYGGNDNDGNDKNAPGMIVDACKAADAAGVNFSQYDVDNDGYIDNVFVYYAGYNEAEWGEHNTVWPHRWGVYPGYNYSGDQASITFDGKVLSDYACTSELKGNSGSNMCGIGTFTHEFGHVLGLVDFYATDPNATHQTLSVWDIMDYGPYLNSGRTPPYYSSHERFYLNWLTPTILNSPRNVTLDPIGTSNTAYMITQTGTSNLDGENPNPVQYFMLENRQKTGWDAYLPGHGMLISRINYNSTNWYNNEANNDPNNMGDDIIEADKKASDNNLYGDPFPGTSNVTSYIPKLVNGTELTNYPITEITEKNNTISFKFMGGVNDIIPPVALDATDVTYKSFVAKWEDTSGLATGYYLSVYTKNGDKINYALDSVWIKKATTDTVINLISNKDYYYVVRASNKTPAFTYETISEKSNEMLVHTEPYSASVKYTKLTPLRATVINNGNVLVFAPKTGGTLYIYDINGKLVGKDICNEEIYKIPSANIAPLLKGEVYILKYEDNLIKLVINK